MSETRPLKLAVIGDPVAHSASPDLHRALLAAAGLEGTYEAIRVFAGSAAARIDELREAGYAGLNVTTPLKEEAYARADERDAAAEAAGSVNTLVLRDDRVVGHNTDGLGAIGALRDAGLRDLAGKRILVLGAGPTARSCVASLVGAAAATFVWNRTIETAHDLAARFDACVWPRDAHPPDAIVVALPPDAEIADRGVLAALLRSPLVIDANYGSRSTLGTALGRPVVDGLEMLRASARASFALFTATPLEYQ
jgi:shikimate dehydrogenase